MKSERLVALLVAAASVAAPGAAKVKDWRVTPASTEAVILMRAERQPFEYTLMLGRPGKSGFGSRVWMMGVKPYDSAPFTGRTLAAGTYQINSISQQSAWSTCFGSGTVAFTVQPGKVYYLGTLNVVPLLKDLQHSAISRGKTSLTSGSLAVGWQPTVKPEFVSPDADELAEVRQFVAATMPKTTALVEVLTTASASFGTSGGKKIIQVCG